MTNKKLIKAFIAGLTFPAVFLPLAYTFLFIVNPRIPDEPVQFIPMYIPLLFGLTNMVFIRTCDETSAKKINRCLWLTGGGLGLIVAAVGVFILKIPALIFGTTFSADFQYLPLIVLPIIYGAVFRYIVKWLNKTLAV